MGSVLKSRTGWEERIVTMFFPFPFFFFFFLISGFIKASSISSQIQLEYLSSPGMKLKHRDIESSV